MFHYAKNVNKEGMCAAGRKKCIRLLTVDKRRATRQQKDVIKDCDSESEGRRERQKQ